MGRGVVGTTCTLTVHSWGGPPPVEGDFLRTDAGSCYRIDAINGKRLRCTRLGKDAVQFGEPGVSRWIWSKRSR